jgi:hypothetical protein
MLSAPCPVAYMFTLLLLDFVEASNGCTVEVAIPTENYRQLLSYSRAQTLALALLCVSCPYRLLQCLLSYQQDES